MRLLSPILSCKIVFRASACMVRADKSSSKQVGGCAPSALMGCNCPDLLHLGPPQLTERRIPGLTWGCWWGVLLFGHVGFVLGSLVAPWSSCMAALEHGYVLAANQMPFFLGAVDLYLVLGWLCSHPGLQNGYSCSTSPVYSRYFFKKFCSL